MLPQLVESHSGWALSLTSAHLPPGMMSYRPDRLHTSSVGDRVLEAATGSTRVGGSDAEDCADGSTDVISAVAKTSEARVVPPPCVEIASSMHRVLHFPGQRTSTSDRASEPWLQLYEAHAGGSAGKDSGQPNDVVVVTTAGCEVDWANVVSAGTEPL